MIARTLTRRVVMRTSEHDVFDALRFFACEPEIAVTAADHVLTVEPAGRWLRIDEEGADAVEVLDARGAVDHIHNRLMTLSVGAKPHAATLHAASLRRRGRRILLVGHEYTGKTTLALRLVRAGYEIEGDEHVFLETDGVVARPRGCRVKETSLALLADVADVIAASPCYVDDYGRRTFNLDPRAVGSPWRIDKGPVDCVVMLHANHGGSSSLRPISPLALAEQVMTELGPRERGRGGAVAAIAALVRTCTGFDLSLGDHAGAVKCIDRVVE